MNDPHHHDFDWNDIYSGDESDLFPPDPLMLELTDPLTPGSVLDVGCGAGGLLLALAERGWELHGIDVAPRAIVAAKKILARAGVDVELAVADAARWRPSRTYDLVTNCFAMPSKHADQRLVCRAIRESVAPGGLVLLKDFDPQMSGFGAFGGFDMVDVKDLIADFEGFEILRAEVVDTPAHDHDHGAHGDESWTASLLFARAPTRTL